MPRLLVVPLVVLFIAGVVHAAVGGETKHTVDSPRWTDEYDRYFRKYSKRYFKAQGIAESALNPESESHVGAKGVMQIMPATFGDIQRSNPHFTSIDEPRWNIAAGIWYNRSLFKAWQKRVPQSGDRLNFTFASYNAGLGTIQKAWKRAGGPDRERLPWQDVAPKSPRETQAYVRRITELMGR
ncbi:MAG: transglycosylase SLT domain-containing protein [Gammaproteobacteria bacterium]